jgi:hypothetical protein
MTPARETRESLPIVIAEHFLPGYEGDTVCPLTGQRKSKGSILCRTAYSEFGGNKTVQTLQEVMERVQEAGQNQTPGEEPPETVFAVIAQIKMDKGAKRFKGAKPSDARFWAFRGLPEGGKIHVTFFGCTNHDRGKEITAVILLKKKAKDFRPYLTVWKVEGLRSNAVFTLNEEKVDRVLPHCPLVWAKGMAQIVGHLGFYRRE